MHQPVCVMTEGHTRVLPLFYLCFMFALPLGWCLGPMFYRDKNQRYNKCRPNYGLSLVYTFGRPLGWCMGYIFFLSCAQTIEPNYNQHRTDVEQQTHRGIIKVKQIRFYICSTSVLPLSYLWVGDSVLCSTFPVPPPWTPTHTNPNANESRTIKPKHNQRRTKVKQIYVLPLFNL